MPESFDEAFPGGMEECVRRLGQEPSVDDPEDLCGWLQENGFKALAEASEEVTDVLLNLDVEYVSVVDEPAQDSEWLLAKSANSDPDGWDPTDKPLREAEVLLKDIGEDEGAEEDDDEPERKVWAAVLEPGTADKQGDLIPDPEIENTAHNYLKHYRKVDEDHNLLDGSGVPIESYIVRDGPETFTTPDGQEKTHPEGTWVMGVELTEDAWKRVEEGELTGFSIYGGASSLDPGTLLSEEQAEALKAYRDLSKEVPDELDAALRAFVESVEDPGETTFVEFVEFVVEESDTGELDLGDMTVSQESDEDGDDDSPDEDDDETDEDEQEKATNPADADRVDAVLKEVRKMGDNPDGGDGEQNETNDKLDQILEKVEKAATSEEVEEVRKSVSSVQERVEELEEWKKSVTGASEGDGEETPEDGPEGDGISAEEAEDIASEVAEDAAEEGAEKALTKFLGLDADELPDDPDEREEVVRKGVRTIGGETEEEGGDTLNISNANIMEEV